MTCSEVQQLRTFLSHATRRKVCEKLVVKYERGRRSAAQVCQALDALKAQGRYDECDDVVAQSLAAVEPVPTVLWTWACSNVATLGCTTIRTMLAMCAASTTGAEARRYARHLAPRRATLLNTPDGIVALAHERHRFPDWAPDALRTAVRAWL